MVVPICNKVVSPACRCSKIFKGDYGLFKFECGHRFDSSVECLQDNITLPAGFAYNSQASNVSLTLMCMFVSG